MDTLLLDSAIHKVPHFPKPGVLFYDITGILTNSMLFKRVVDYYYDRYKDNKPVAIAAIDSRGFIFGSPVAYLLEIPLILIRKFGKLARTTIKQEFALEYGNDALEVNPDDIVPGNIVVFDDVLATGGTAEAACLLLTRMNATIQEIASIIALDFLPYAQTLQAYPYHFVVSYNTELVDEN